MTSANRKDLDDILHPDLVFIHSVGVSEGKEQHIEAVTSGTLVYNSFEERDTRYLAVGDGIAVRTGRMAISLSSRGSEMLLNVLFTNTWVMDGGKWRMIASHNTRIPDAAR